MQEIAAEVPAAMGSAKLKEMMQAGFHFVRLNMGAPSDSCQSMGLSSTADGCEQRIEDRWRSSSFASRILDLGAKGSENILDDILKRHFPNFEENEKSEEIFWRKVRTAIIG